MNYRENHKGKIIKSAVTTDEAKIRFINQTNRPVDIIWISFTSQLVPYKSLKPYQFVDVNTYTNHVWIAVDSVTRDNMYLNRKEVFVVENFKCDIKVRNTRRIISQGDVRILIYITLPLDSLKICAIKIVRDLIKTIENIDYLELPYVLKCDIKESFENKSKNSLP